MEERARRRIEFRDGRGIFGGRRGSVGVLIARVNKLYQAGGGAPSGWLTKMQGQLAAGAEGRTLNEACVYIRVYTRGCVREIGETREHAGMKGYPGYRKTRRNPPRRKIPPSGGVGY